MLSPFSGFVGQHNDASVCTIARQTVFFCHIRDNCGLTPWLLVPVFYACAQPAGSLQISCEQPGDGATPWDRTPGVGRSRGDRHRSEFAPARIHDQTRQRARNQLHSLEILEKNGWPAKHLKRYCPRSDLAGEPKYAAQCAHKQSAPIQAGLAG